MASKREEKLIALVPALIVCRLLEHGCLDIERLRSLARTGTEAIVNYVTRDEE